MLKKLFTLLSFGFIVLNAQEKIDIKGVKKGLLCLTFDDSHYDQWIEHLPLFEKYHAHATFFYYHDLDKPAINSMKKLRKAGHSVGLHSIHHREATTDIEKIGVDVYIREEIQPQIETMKANGLPAKFFAYPYGARNADTECMFSKIFHHCRAGIDPYPGKGYWIADQKQAFIDLDKIEKTLTLGGVGVGESYLSTKENLDAALEKAARDNKLLVLYSHGISLNAARVDIRTDLLEHILCKAEQLGLKIVSMDELP